MRIYVIYDSVTNSVFDGQMLARITSDDVLISFEPDIHKAQKKKLPIHVHLVARLPFIHTFFLIQHTAQLKKILSQYTGYELIARGPIAGYIALHAIDPRCTNFTVQARGLLGQEHLYTHRADHWLQRMLHRIRARQFQVLEKKIYTNYQVRIEAVSPALATYIKTTYHAHHVTVATDDIPAPMPVAEKDTARAQIRLLLNITTQTVYCYNGSAKPWQCPELVISFFKKHKNNSVLLILTQDIQAFEKLLMEIPKSQYRLCTVEHSDIYRYLAAADYGIIFREQSIVNWTSRPTKVLEYQAVGLPIIHNNTIAYLDPLDGV